MFLPASYWDRIIQAINMLYYSFGPLLSIFLLSTLLLSMFIKQTRYIIFIVITPPLLLWMLFYCYDYRNLSLTFPFIAYSSAFGLKYFYEKNVWMKKHIQILNLHYNLNKALSKRKKTILRCCDNIVCCRLLFYCEFRWFL